MLHSNNKGISKIGTIISVILIIAVIGSVVSVYYYLYLRTPEPQVDIQIGNPDRVPTGQPFSVSVSYANRSDKVLQGGKLVLVVPDGISILGISPDQRAQEITVGNIPPGSQESREFNLIATQDSQTLKELTASLRYSITESPNATFEATNSVDISLGQPAIALNLVTPDEIISGEQFNVKLEYVNRSDHTFDNLTLAVQEPQNFSFKESDPTFQNENDGIREWTIANLKGSEEGSITLIGSAQGAPQSFIEFSAGLEARFFGRDYTLIEKQGLTEISSAPLTLNISANNTTEYIAQIGDNIQYRFNYRNNSDTTLKNAQVRAMLTSPLFDFSELEAEGSFNSISNTVLWNTANTPELETIAPGESGTLLLRVRLKDEFPIRSLSDRDFSLNVEASMESPTIPQGIVAEKTIALADITSQVAGKAEVEAKGFFYEPSANILNNGPYPPKVNEATQYTVHWLITNHSTDVKNVEISAFLQSGARFTGVVESNANTEPTYNNETGKVVWRLPSIPATRGVISPPLEATFQIEATPAINQAGGDMPLLSETVLSAEDVFTGTTLESVDREITTELEDDNRIQVPRSRRGVQE